MSRAQLEFDVIRVVTVIVIARPGDCPLNPLAAAARSRTGYSPAVFRLIATASAALRDLPENASCLDSEFFLVGNEEHKTSK